MKFELVHGPLGRPLGGLAWDGKEMLVAADTVIVCAGQEPCRAVAGTHLIGGAKEAGELDAKRAMLEGAEVAAAL